MASPTTAAEQDRKGVRTASPSISSASGNGFSNVVDHLAPGVTENVPSRIRIPKRHDKIDKIDTIIHVQPLRKDEMQVRSPSRSRSRPRARATIGADLLQPSYAQDMGVGGVEHGIYGSLLNILGAAIGCIGAIPCMPCPNPFREVHQGAFAPLLPRDYANQALLLGSVGLVTRFGQFYKAVDPGLVQVNVCTESLKVVDVKIQIAAIGRQNVITRDNVSVDVYVTPSYQIPLHFLISSLYIVTRSSTSKSTTRTEQHLELQISGRPLLNVPRQPCGMSLVHVQCSLWLRIVKPLHSRSRRS